MFDSLEQKNIVFHENKSYLTVVDSFEKKYLDISPLEARLCNTVLSCILHFFNLRNDNVKNICLVGKFP